MYEPRKPRRLRKSARPPVSWRRRVLLGLAVVVGFALSGGIGAGIYFLPALQVALHDTGVSGTSPTPAAGSTTSAAPATGTPLSSAAPSLTPAVTPASEPPPGAPFTVLLLGSDSDAKFTGGVYLTQSMILARVNPSTKAVTMLSIPRDLWVPLCTGNTGKIDQAYEYGGADCSISTVEQDFNVRVDYYAWIGLQGLVSMVNDVGGVDVVASNPVMDDYYPADLSGSNPYAYERILVLPGAQQMDGTLALEYVRSRHDDLLGDFGRSIRQQQVLIALRAKAKLLSLADLPNIASDLGSFFVTDMSLSQVGQLVPIASRIPLSSIKQVVLTGGYTTSSYVGNQSVLLPDWNQILPLVQQYFPSS